MPRRELEGHHHVARQCSHQELQIEEDGTASGVHIGAFELRPNLKETYLSTAWIEYFEGALTAQLKQILAALRTRMKPEKLGPKSALLRLRVGEIVECGATQERKIRVELAPKDWNAGYTKVHGLPADNSDQELLQLLTQMPSLSIHQLETLDAA